MKLAVKHDTRLNPFKQYNAFCEGRSHCAKKYCYRITALWAVSGNGKANRLDYLQA